MVVDFSFLASPAACGFVYWADTIALFAILFLRANTIESRRFERHHFFLWNSEQILTRPRHCWLPFYQMDRLQFFILILRMPNCLFCGNLPVLCSLRGCLESFEVSNSGSDAWKLIRDVPWPNSPQFWDFLRNLMCFRYELFKLAQLWHLVPTLRVHTLLLFMDVFVPIPIPITALLNRWNRYWFQLPYCYWIPIRGVPGPSMLLFQFWDFLPNLMRFRYELCCIPMCVIWFWVMLRIIAEA